MNTTRARNSITFDISRHSEEVTERGGDASVRPVAHGLEAEPEISR